MTRGPLGRNNEMSIILSSLGIPYPRWPLSSELLYALNLLYHIVFVVLHAFDFMVKVVVFSRGIYLATGIKIFLLLQNIFGLVFHSMCYLEPILDRVLFANPVDLWQTRRLIQQLDVLLHRLLIDMTILDLVVKAVILYPYSSASIHVTFYVAVIELLINCYCAQIPIQARLPNFNQLVGMQVIGGGDGTDALW